MVDNTFDILMRTGEFAHVDRNKLVYEAVTLEYIGKLTHNGIPECSDSMHQTGTTPEKPCMKCFMFNALDEGLIIGRATGFRQ